MTAAPLARRSNELRRMNPAVLSILCARFRRPVAGSRPGRATRQPWGVSLCEIFIPLVATDPGLKIELDRHASEIAGWRMTLSVQRELGSGSVDAWACQGVLEIC